MLHQRYYQLHLQAVTAVAELESAINRCPTTEQLIQLEGDMLANFTDNIYAMRETYGILDRLRKTVKKLHEDLQTVACALYMEAQPTQMTETGRIQGDYATGHPVGKVAIGQLKREKCPALYDRFCREMLGVTNESLIESGSIEVHYKYFGDWLSEQLAKGFVAPEVLSQVKQYNELEFKVTKRKALLS